MRLLPEYLKRLLRPLKESAIKLAYRRKGVRRVINGLELRVDSRCRHRFASDYEAHTADFLSRNVGSGAVVYNIGANVGALALQLATWVGPTGRVIAFEPNPYAQRLLHRNLRLNRLDSRVAVIDAAIGDTSNGIDLHVYGPDGMSRAGRANPSLTSTETIRVQVTTLDRFANQYPPPPDWIVMDIEGWEIAALRGARQILTSGPKIGIVVELHPNAWCWSGDTRADLERLLSDYARIPVGLDGQEDPLDEHGHVYLSPAL